ncbi:MAG: carbohydrate ABC transporter permease [Clostridia bacterium]|nr:carbohydrate ABC transporter permease [Clostridia bacterium]
MLLPMLALAILPIMYIVFTAFKPIGELFAYPPQFITERPTWDNFRKLFEASENTVFPLSMYLFNSIVSTVSVVFLGMFIATASAYVLSKKRFRGRDLIFKLNNLSMMFVATAVSIPRYLIVKEVGLLDSFFANIIPMLAVPVTVFLLKQFVDQLPDALIESATIDGANDYQILFKIIMPLVKSALATTAILLFQNSWNSMEASNLFISTESLKTFAFYMNSLSVSGNGVAGVGMSAAAALLMFMPNVILFVIMQSRVMSTMAHSGIK